MNIMTLDFRVCFPTSFILAMKLCPTQMCKELTKSLLAMPEIIMCYLVEQSFKFIYKYSTTT